MYEILLMNYNSHISYRQQITKASCKFNAGDLKYTGKISGLVAQPRPRNLQDVFTRNATKNVMSMEGVFCKQVRNCIGHHEKQQRNVTHM